MSIHTIEGKLYLPNSAKIAIVAARFNAFVVEALVKGALDGLVRHGIDRQDITLVYAPGAYELPLVAKRLADTQKFSAVIALGAVIRGATPHFDVVAFESAKGLSSAMLATNTPIINGILTTDTIEQAIERAGTKSGNKGFDAAVVAIEMVSLFSQTDFAL